ncbi:mannitol dehydrogenase [Raoultella sp. Ech2A]|uniref:mannitol dehydrogenase family protein n=1 Tax=Raoultella sp. Ech2A TaxID=2996539 RepID=UPI0024C0DA3A|nr:hypothetical protein [Raoultella sp. Ech2A]MDJ1653668.1 mannitol dehydrogenase [Raoultella sp. Ech2A]
MRALHFGAGGIGRGFIGDLLAGSGYDITFVERNVELNAQINERHGYNLHLIEKEYQKKFIPTVRALSPESEFPAVVQAMVDADLITTAVWADNLPKIAPLILAGLLARGRAGRPRINVLACENALLNGEILRREIQRCAGSEMAEIDELAAFPNTAVDRMVLTTRREGLDVVDIGVDYELVIDKHGLVDEGSRPINDAIYTHDLRKYLERKLYIINGGHAWAGYIGHLKGYQTMQEIFSNDGLRDEIQQSMRETARLLHLKYAFPVAELEEYIRFVIKRFSTPGITDTVRRVCRSPIRKLSPEDRLTAPCVQCEAAGLPADYLVKGVAAAMHYFDPQDEQSILLQKYIAEHNASQAITHFTGVQQNTQLHDAVLFQYAALMPH